MENTNTASPENVSRWKREVGYLERQLHALGQWTRVERRLHDLTKTSLPTVTRVPCEGKTPEETSEIHRAHMIDAMCWSFEELIAGKLVYAFRGLLQATDHAAHCGHNPVTKDASIELQNAIESALLGRK